MNNLTCCFTGHRPQKIFENEQAIIFSLEKAIVEAVSNGYTTFITGMAYGVDIWAAEIVLRLKRKHNLKLICAVPHPNFEKRWSLEWQERYNKIVSSADEVHCISNYYSKGCYQIRNIWMVDHSSLVIAAYNGTIGGTKNTIVYAKQKNKKVVNVLDYPLS